MMTFLEIDDLLIFGSGRLQKNSGWDATSNIYHLEDCECELRDDEILLSKAWFSETTIFYYYVNDLLIVCKHWQDIVKLLHSNGFKQSVDPSYMWFYLQYQTPLTSNTLCREIKYLRAGEIISFKNNAISKKQYEINGSKTKFKEFNLRGRLTEKLSGLNVEKTVFHLSSGLDSSILAILAAEANPNNSLNFATCLTKASGCSDEIDNVKRLAKDLNGNLVIFDFLNIDIFEEGLELVMNCLGYPTAHPSHLVEFMLDKHLAKKFDTIITGRGPDECLGGYPWHQQQYSNAILHQERITVTQPSLLAGLLTMEEPPAEALAFVGEKELSLKDRLHYDLLTISESWNIISASVENYFKIKILSPFLESSLRQKMFFLADSEKIDDKKGKIYMRNHFHKDYPSYISNFAKRGMRLDLQPYLANYTCADILERINLNPDFIQKYFHENTIKRMIFETKHNIHNYGWQIWSIYLMSCSSQRFTI